MLDLISLFTFFRGEHPLVGLSFSSSSSSSSSSSPFMDGERQRHQPNGHHYSQSLSLAWSYTHSHMSTVPYVPEKKVSVFPTLFQPFLVRGTPGLRCDPFWSSDVFWHMRPISFVVQTIFSVLSLTHLFFTRHLLCCRCLCSPRGWRKENWGFFFHSCRNSYFFF